MLYWLLFENWKSLLSKMSKEGRWGMENPACFWSTTNINVPASGFWWQHLKLKAYKERVLVSLHKETPDKYIDFGHAVKNAEEKS